MPKCGCVRFVGGPGDDRARRKSWPSITYHNVVRRWIKVGEWNGAQATWSVPIEDFKSDGVDAVAVLVQVRHARRGLEQYLAPP